LRTIYTAYALHYPLVLTPDAVWLCIAQGFAMHVSANAERLRDKFVKHQGLATIKVRRDDFIKGSPDNPWPEVFTEFSDAIAEHIGRQRDLVVCDFSTTGPCERAASEIVLMNAMKHYFKYELETLCGIPEITLDGTIEDWKSIRSRARALDEYDLKWWTDALGPVLDQLVATSSGQVDVPFWEALFKQIDGSGGPWVTGWINTLFPYLKRNNTAGAPIRNAMVTNWARNAGRGLDDAPELSLIPPGISVVPFEWNYFGQIYAMEFLGGYVGVAQDMDTLALRPAIGWAVREATGPGVADRDGSTPEAARADEASVHANLQEAEREWIGGRPSDGAALIAGKVSLSATLTWNDVLNATEEVEWLRRESGYPLACVPAGDISVAVEFREVPFPFKLIVGLEVGSVQTPANGIAPVEEPRLALDAARALPARIWEALAALVPGGLSGGSALFLVNHDSSANAMIVYGSQVWEETNYGVEPEVRGVTVSEVAPMRYAIVDVSFAAQVRDEVESKRLEGDAAPREYYLLSSYYIAKPP
jgi:hypothetical protein